jgi:N-carbamoylsarcosine amidase
MDTTEDLDAVLQRVFDESTRIYKERGFQHRIGFGPKPALISVDAGLAKSVPGQ